MNKIPRWRICAGLLRPRSRIVFVFLTAARVAVGLCDLLVAAVTYLLFLLLQGRSPMHDLRWAPKTIVATALSAAVLVLLRAGLDLFSSRSAFRFIQSLYVDFLLRLTEGYSEMAWMRFVGRNRSEILHHALHTAREAADFYHRCIEFISGIIIIAAMAAAILYQSPAAALIFSCALAAFHVLHRGFIQKRVSRAASNREASHSKLQKSVLDLFTAGKEIRTYGIYSFFNPRIQREAEGLAENHRRALFLPQVARIAAEQGVTLLFLGLILAFQLRQADTRQLVSLLAFYFVLSRRMLPLISQLSLIAGQMESSFENVHIVDSELNECHAYRRPTATVQLPQPGFLLQLNQVSFWFEPSKLILRRIDLCLREGETVVLHGASGIGKSTLLNVITGLLPPVHGAVRIDRAAVAYVPQEVPLLDESVRSNLLFGLAAKRDEELFDALEAANLADFIASLPDGLDTPVGDNGALLSGGQRQRLGLARAILRKYPLLLLDEATSALDPESEKQVLANLNALGIAILLVTHRQHIHTFADRVYRLRDGALIEESRLRLQPVS